MKKIYIFLLLMFLSISAFAGNHDKLVGEWSVNVEKMKDSDEFKEAMKGEDLNQVEDIKLMIELMANMTFKFTKNNAIIQIPAPDDKLDEEKANYTIVSDKDKTLEIKFINEKGSEIVKIITFLDDNNIKISPKTGTPEPLEVAFLTKKKAKK